MTGRDHPNTCWNELAANTPRSSNATTILVLGAVFAGWLFFTFIEYGIHRWGYHGHDSPLTHVHKFHHHDGSVLGILSLVVCAVMGPIA
jgi:hypothetical protein